MAAISSAWSAREKRRRSKRIEEQERGGAHLSDIDDEDFVLVVHQVVLPHHAPLSVLHTPL
eukprot:2916813-Rhodomonas_salina.1